MITLYLQDLQPMKAKHEHLVIYQLGKPGSLVKVGLA